MELLIGLNIVMSVYWALRIINLYHLIEGKTERIRLIKALLTWMFMVVLTIAFTVGIIMMLRGL